MQFILFSSLRDKCRVSFSVGKSLRKDIQAPDLDNSWPDQSTPECGFSTGVIGEKTIACSLSKDVWSCQQIINLSLNQGDNIYI